MTKINYKSDFKLLAPIPKTLNFVFHYTTDESVCYDVSIDNGRAIVQDDNLIIVFEDHNLPIGQLKVRKEYLIEDEDAQDDVLDVITGEYLDIFLLDCKTDQFKGIIVEEELTIYRGYSAYQIAVRNGFVGTEQEWLESLKEPAKQAAEEAEQKVDALITKGEVEINKVHKAIQDANTATNAATSAANSANDAAVLANSAAANANSEADKAKQATQNAISATTSANAATVNANTAASNAVTETAKIQPKLNEVDTAITNANNATTEANTAANNANTAAEYANTEGSKVEGLRTEVENFMAENQETIDDMVDKVETFDKRVDELKLFKTPNLTLFGAPTINEGQISNFTATDYAAFPFLVDFKNRPFEINMCLTTATNLSGQHNIFDSNFGLALAIRERKIVLAASTNGVTWDLGEQVGTSTLPTNTTVYLKLVYDGTTYTMYYSLDKTAYNTEFTFTGGALYPKQIIIGKSINNANYFNGSINLNNCYLLIDGLQIWQGMDDAGLATRLATDLSNIDAAGEDKIQELTSNKANTDGYYYMLGAGTADNLAARGDSYEVEFSGTRKTGGELDVEEGSATIKSIKGRTLVLNQITKPSIENRVYSFTNGTIEIRMPYTNFNASDFAIFKMKPNHKYFLYTKSSKDFFRLGNYYSDGLAINANKGIIYTYSISWPIVLGFTSGAEIGTSDLSIISVDLTQMFGAGNEPSTALEFANKIGYNSVEEIPYFEYNEGTLINNDVKSITSTVPDEEPFVRLLPTNKYFEDGLKSAGIVYDEMTSTKAIKRVGVVDLGILDTFKYNDELGIVYCAYKDYMAYSRPNLLCFKYSYTNSLIANMPDKGIGGGGGSSNIFFIRDTNFIGKTISEIKQSLQGVLLYYELAEPVETEYDELNLMYNVHPLGTETVEFNTEGVHTYRGEHVYGLDFYTTVKSLLARVKALEGK